MKIPLGWLKEYVDFNVSPQALAKELTMHGLEVPAIEENVIEVDVLPNRGDCLSVRGVAREVSAILGRPMKKKKITLPRTKSKQFPKITVQVLDKKACPRYCARVVKNVKIGPSPSWLQNRLLQCGLRPINNVVDITNYILLELGQPMHAFDLDLVAGNKIVVRAARKEEKLVTIDGTALLLGDKNLVIADTGGPVALAGVMGGKKSEVNAATQNILLESAYFEPTGIYRTSRSAKIRTESSIRFEKGVDLEVVEEALDLGAALLADLCGGEISPQKIDVLNTNLKKKQLTLELAELKRILGLKLNAREVKKILVALGFDFVKGTETGGKLVFAVPFGRARDVDREIDLIEEVIRIYGYGRVPSVLPNTVFENKVANPFEEFVEKVRGELIACGLDEIKTYSMVSARDFDQLGYAQTAPERNCPELSNPLSLDAAWMRPTLLPGLLKTVELNQNWQATTCPGLPGEQAYFEIDKVFASRKEGAEETLWAAVALVDLPQLSRWQMPDRQPADFYWLKGVLRRVLGLVGISDFSMQLQPRTAFQPGMSAVCVVKQRTGTLSGEEQGTGLPVAHLPLSEVAYLGKLHPAVAAHYKLKKSVYLLEINLGLLFELLKPSRKYQPLPKYPSVDRDIAMIVSADIPYQSIREVIVKSAGNLAERVELFDLFSGQGISPGHYSLAVHVVYRDSNKTLSDEDVNRLHAQVLETLKNNLKIEIRM